jgi:hypothetical protein
VPLAVITTILLRLAVAEQRRKDLTGEAGLINSTGVARTDRAPMGSCSCTASCGTPPAYPRSISKGALVRVRQVKAIFMGD